MLPSSQVTPSESIHRTPASFFSLSIRSSTEFTSLPPSRFGGSVTSKTSRRGSTLTPRSKMGIVSIGFFLAFMMFGRLAYLGSFSRRSQVSTAGTERLCECREGTYAKSDTKESSRRPSKFHAPLFAATNHGNLGISPKSPVPRQPPGSLVICCPRARLSRGTFPACRNQRESTLRCAVNVL